MIFFRFRWAVCQLDVLRTSLNVPMLRKALASLPKTLDETYDRILNNIDDNNRELAFKMLQWLVSSGRPLQQEELAEAIIIDVNAEPAFNLENRFPDPEDILTICSSLITTDTDEGEPG